MVLSSYGFRDHILPYHKRILNVKFIRGPINIMGYITFTIDLSTM